MTGQSRIFVPIPVDASKLLSVTVGAWVKLTSNDERVSDKRYYQFSSEFLKSKHVITLYAGICLHIQVWLLTVLRIMMKKTVIAESM